MTLSVFVALASPFLCAWMLRVWSRSLAKVRQSRAIDFAHPSWDLMTDEEKWLRMQFPTQQEMRQTEDKDELERLMAVRKEIIFSLLSSTGGHQAVQREEGRIHVLCVMSNL